MKINRYIKTTTIIVLALSTLFTSCKDKDDDNNNTVNNGQNEENNNNGTNTEGINFQNERLLTFLLQSTDVDKNGDKVITHSEANEITSLNLNSQGLGDLSDLKSFKSLEKLDCSYNNLSTLNLSPLYFLQELNCDGNNLSELDLSDNDRLKVLSCEKNKLDTLNVMSNNKLNTIYCGNQKTEGNLKLVIDNKQYTNWTSNSSNEKNGSVDIVMNLFEDGNIRYLINNENIEIGETATLLLPMSTTTLNIKKNGSNLSFDDKSVWEQTKWESTDESIVEVRTAITPNNTFFSTFIIKGTPGRTKIIGTDGLGNSVYFFVKVISNN